MLNELITNHAVSGSILLVGAVSLVLQLIMTISLRGYVKASANMKTTKKKIMLNLKNQFEAIYGMDSEVHNTAAYVDKYLSKLRFLGLPYMVWERVPALTAGVVSLLAVGGAFYEYINGAKTDMYVEIVFSYGMVLAFLYVFFHIFGIKSRKQQIQIQLVDYLENYLSNRLARTRDSRQSVDAGMTLDDKTDISEESESEDDMMMLRRLLTQMETGESRAYTKMQAEKEKERQEAEACEQIAASEEQSDLELLEEFVQSFLA